ncbi:sulfotransferase domain-containing protein [Salinibacter altiplanensis]|uniref:sulfotransferase domain-containing protein n=1 Tax=Salinibacter altiplanensis TaxID=1803181 RepID=UPI000C9F4031|nr:sulfotransferase domain-containing protein [Salinibacter altiplanensis]
MQFVVSYPKSGNTWVRLVAAAYTLSDDVLMESLRSPSASADLPASLQYTDVERYQYQTICPFPIDDINFPTEVRLRPAAMLVLNREKSLTTSQRPALIKSHHINGEVNNINLWNGGWAEHVVNPVRDPREVCCSFAAHREMSYMETAELMNDSTARMGEEDKRIHSLLTTWSTHVRSWLQEETMSVHTVQYEDLQADPVGEFYDILDFLEVEELTEERVEDAVERTRFDRMQDMEAEHGFHEATADQEQFFRSGQTEGWRDELPPDVARKIEEDHGDVMERLGYL